MALDNNRKAGKHLSFKVKLLLSLLMVGGIYMLYRYNPATHPFMPKCPFKLLTGLDCPGCGGQRAVYALLHGHLIEAVKANLYLVYAGPYALSFLIRDWFLYGKWKERVTCVIENRYVVWFYIITFCLWLVVRNLLSL